MCSCPEPDLLFKDTACSKGWRSACISRTLGGPLMNSEDKAAPSCFFNKPVKTPPVPCLTAWLVGWRAFSVAPVSQEGLGGPGVPLKGTAPTLPL